VVAAQSECGPCEVDKVWITTAQGEAVEGVATDLSDLRRVGAWAFTPSSPWQPGEYLAHYDDGEPAPFTVLSEPMSPPVIQPSLGSTITQRRNEVQCVSELPTTEKPDGNFTSFSLTGWTHGYFELEAVGISKAQYTYMIGVNGEIRFDPYGADVLFEIGPGVPEICYWVRAQGLVSREEILLVDDCYSPAQLDEYVVENATQEELETFLREECVLPPPGLFSEWCATFQSAIDKGGCSDFENQNMDACESALGLCLGGAGDSEESRRSSEGCTLSGSHDPRPARNAGGLLVVLSTIAVLLLRRNRVRDAVPGHAR